MLNGKVALVTGGGSGIGYATALALAKHGATVVIGNRRVEAGQKAAADIQAVGGTAIFQQTDVTQAEQVQLLVDLAVSEFGRLDIAFNNAGGFGPVAPLGQQADADFDRIFEVNVKGVFLCMKAQIGQMQKQGSGVIINNASTTGIRNMTHGVSLYAASKSAVISFTKSAAIEYAQQGLRINAVVPGRIDTDMLRSASQDVSRFAADLPMRRVGQPKEVADAVVWLASDHASFVTGHLLAVDGGFLAE